MSPVRPRVVQRMLTLLLVGGAILSGCSASVRSSGPPGGPPPGVATTPADAPAPAISAGTSHAATSTPDHAPAASPDATALERPDWLGTRVLPLTADGFGARLPTPPELTDRRLPPAPIPAPTPPAPPDDGTFRSTIEPVPAQIAARSTWRPGCPVTLDELRYVTVTFVGFDGRDHTGELLLHRDVAVEVAGAFAALHAARFPLEELRIIAAHELELPPTGDGNVSSAFVCRPSVGATRWSQHAYGLAVDLNPFHNPYVRGDLILPELAGAYVDRDLQRPGMVLPGGPATDAFAAIGWGWGGDWSSAADWMHFSATGR
jgi:hypothetical protein